MSMDYIGSLNLGPTLGSDPESLDIMVWYMALY